jgi:hypothetical protein
MTPVAIVGRPLRTIVLLGLVLLGAACGGTRPVAEPDLEARYRAAIEDARTAAPSEITTSLTPLVPYNESLVWRTMRDSIRQVLVVTWGGADTLPTAATGDTVTTDQDVWVTAVPQLRQFCGRLDRQGDALQLRLAQRLGLPPDADYDRFVELWVRPQDLVRPCPDPEVTDRECELSPPVPTTHVQISDAHRDWFRGLRQTSYGPDGYPFTGLGYTYDWNPSTDEVGPSEFVLRPGETATVNATYTTGEYCRVPD